MISKHDLFTLSEKVRGGYDNRPFDLRKLPYGDSRYYILLYELALKFQPSVVVELGTYLGTAARHLAAGGAGWVYTVECDTGLEQAPYENGVTFIQGKALDMVDQIKADVGKIDWLFIDTDHVGEHAQAEYDAYRPMMTDGGLIVIDDIDYDDSMWKFWASLPEPKVDLPGLHAVNGTSLGIQLVESIP